MDDQMKKYWEQQLIKIATQESMFKSTCKLTWKEKLHNKYLDLIDSIYHKLTGRWPYEE